MKDMHSMRRRALDHMEAAQALLIDAGESHAALHLQAAHDIVTRIIRATPSANNRVEVDADPALVRAIGGALAVFATWMARGGIAPIDEIAGSLGIFAAAAAETSAEEGLIIGCWSAILHEASQMPNEETAD
ncbi:hypothetical protein [Tardiphaga sp.]|uniref:hypothetical protein n=1 Tax=Tardiphaga sp. TaxID=1926292 RepID=UPI00352A16A3